MKSLQEVFDEIIIHKTEKKHIQEEYRDALINANEYQEICDQIKELREKKKQIEIMVKNQLGSRYEKLEELKLRLAELSQAQSDIAISDLTSGKTVMVKDNFDNLYEPKFVVKFKKTELRSQEEKPTAKKPAESIPVEE